MTVELTKIELGNITLPKGKVIATDPCYDTDVWCTEKVDVKPGDYICRAKYGVYPGWGERVFELTINHITCPKKKAVKVIGSCGVDSGQCGFFELDNYIENHPKMETEKSEEWYNRACDITLNDDEHCVGIMGVLDGVVASSGLGDGMYTLYAGYDNRGQITALRLRFL